MQELRAGAVDGTFPWNPDADDRPDFSNASYPLYHIEMRFYRNANSDITVSELTDLHGLSICRPAGYSLISDKIKQMIEDNQVVHAAPKDMEACFRMLDLGRVDLVLPDSELEAILAIRKAVGSIDYPVPTDFLLARIPMALLMTNKNPANIQVLTILNKALEDMDKTGELKVIRERHKKLLFEEGDKQ